MTGSRPKKLGSFEILREIAQGGMGVVYLARQPALERLVVLKKIRRELVADPRMVERFEREARACAAVHHQNVVAVYDCFAIRGDHYIAQELVDGDDLRAVMDQVGRFDPEVAALIALEVVRGLEEIHARGIVHRDLKPANILIGRGGEVKIADFGIALGNDRPALTRPGTLVGSVPYLSPEQIMGERVDYRSDLYLFGILLYELLTGTQPFTESEEDSPDTLLERMQAGSYDSPRKLEPKIPRHLVRLIRSCLRPKPGQRIQSAHQVRRHLEWRLGNVSSADCRRDIAAYLWRRCVMRTDDEATTLQPALLPAPRRFRRAQVRLLIPIGAVALLIAAAVGGYTLGRPDPEPVAAAIRTAAPRAEVPVSAPPNVTAAAGTSLTVDRATPPAAPAPAEPARVRFVANPWAEVRIDGASALITPRAAPIELAPGSHVVTFIHPRYGSAEHMLTLEPGEERLIRHDYPEASQP